ncbi:hypothetical protein T05_13894 [Trichinella murrelli]|uniref:Uncharacterized protein n=1 Tax=Trichinella murrelli TaxID=144512 RepID=A0A0V0TLL8_9BILA|nr:hypothetical protein T05_13894 [Trichinella murrelli]
MYVKCMSMNDGSIHQEVEPAQVAIDDSSTLCPLGLLCETRSRPTGQELRLLERQFGGSVLDQKRWKPFVANRVRESRRSLLLIGGNIVQRNTTRRMPSFQVGISKLVALRTQVASAGRECVAKFENQPRKQPIDGGNGKLKNGFVHDHFGDSQPSREPPQEGSPAIQSLIGRGWNPASGWSSGSL